MKRLFLLLACSTVALPLHAQLAPPVQIQFFNAAGTAPNASGFVCTTQSGGTVSQLTYQDQALSIPNQNPVRLNAAGRPVNGSNEVSIFLQNLNYRFTVYAAGTGNTCNGLTVGALLKQVDGVNGALVVGSAQVANLGLGAAADGTARLLMSQASNTVAVILTNSSVARSWNIYNITNGPNTDLRLQESNGSADRVTFQAGGNVGIGTTNPTSTLHVVGTTNPGTIVSSVVGPHAIGGGTNAAVQLLLTGTFTGSGDANGYDVATTFQPTANSAARGILVNPTFTKASAGTHPLFAGIQVTTPTFVAGASAITDAVQIDIATITAPATTTNATGLRIAAPTAATNNYAATFFQSDGATVIQRWFGNGDIQWGKALVTLGGGAAPTLGTIGGSGPTAAAQNSWMRVLDSSGAAFWVPAWK